MPIRDLFKKTKAVEKARPAVDDTVAGGQKSLWRIAYPKAVDNPGDVIAAPRKGQYVSNVELRQLRDLLRQRYSLDLEIWSYRDVPDYDRPVIEIKMRKADALLARVQTLVANMDQRKRFRSDAEWEQFVEVRDRIQEDGKRVWMQDPPWPHTDINGFAPTTEVY